MRLEQVPHGQIDELRLRWAAATAVLPASVVPGAEAQLQFSDRDSIPMLRIGPDVLGVAGDGRKNEALLADLCTRHLPRLAWIVDAGPAAMTIQVHTFLHALPLPPVDVGVDEKILESLERLNPQLRTQERALDWLREQFLLDGTGDTGIRAFATAGADASNGGFVLHGRSARAFIRRTKRADKSDGLFIDKVVRGQSRVGEPLALVTGAVRFVDATVAGKLRADAAAELSSLVASGSSFLDVWGRYGAIENEAALRRARRARWLSYDHVESLPDNRYRFRLGTDCTSEGAEAFKKTLSEEQGLSVEADATVPEVLTREMTWAEYEALPRPGATTATASFGAKVELNRRDRTVTLTQRRGDEVAPPSPGVLFVSLHGDKTRLKRREEAGRAIREARCPMPQLGLLLEERPVPTPRRGTVLALTPSVKRKVFGNSSPTPTQEEALRVALNTPDIALIQGPPGTGKTTIVVALVERLQEVWDASDGVQGRLLLSGFQHDAVENAIQRMSANGLPPIKFGGRQNRREDADRVDATIDKWSTERGAAIRAALPARPVSALQRELASVVEAYLLAPSTLEQTGAMLARVADSLRALVPATLTDRMLALGRELSDRVRTARQGDPDQERAVRYTRALRCEPRPFADDGPRNAYRLAQQLVRTERLDPDSRKLLDAAAGWVSRDAPPFLDELRALRRRLLLALLPVDRTNDTVPRARTDVLAVLTEARDDLDRRHRSSRDAADEAVWTFLSALEGDPEAVKQAVISYTSVFAATCQQCQPTSKHGDLAELKGINGSYDTVIVDEAARATPLDLFIPMSKASRRIVLVGDHRQLPHILDRELERELEEALSSESTAEQRTSEMLNESLFERLFKDLRKREERDGIRRTVTLDEQYRMHPVLGRFVSDQFYAPHGAHEAFRSPRPPEEFAHSLLGYGGPAAWVEVPQALGGETSGQSKSRPAEATAIVAELKRLMDSKEGRGLTFGVISFYSAQVDLIAEELERNGMLLRTKDGATEIVEPYRELRLESGRTAERLRFGTVDAFQGMEFDVVFLSMVRSNTYADTSEKDRRKKFGHLMSPNRLCVAMSRQKRLLIVAGDDTMLRSTHATTAIGPLVQFRELSEVRDAARL